MWAATGWGMESLTWKEKGFRLSWLQDVVEKKFWKGEKLGNTQENAALKLTEKSEVKGMQ